MDQLYEAIAGSSAYRDAIRAANPDLPEWVTPFSITNASDLARIARELAIGPDDSFADLACGMGGPGLWVAEHTGASMVGIDLSRAGTEAGSAIARARGLSTRVRFVVADAIQTGLQADSLAGVMSIDAIQFVDPQRVTVEIARLLRPSGVAVIRTWEAIVDEPPLSTMVRDYCPIFESAGLSIRVHEEIADFREREVDFYRALVECGEALRSEIGDVAEAILEEARTTLARAEQPPRVRKMFIVAEKKLGRP